MVSQQMFQVQQFTAQVAGLLASEMVEMLVLGFVGAMGKAMLASASVHG